MEECSADEVRRLDACGDDLGAVLPTALDQAEKPPPLPDMAQPTSSLPHPLSQIWHKPHPSLHLPLPDNTSTLLLQLGAEAPSWDLDGCTLSESCTSSWTDEVTYF